MENPCGFGYCKEEQSAAPVIVGRVNTDDAPAFSPHIEEPKQVYVFAYFCEAHRKVMRLKTNASKDQVWP